MCELIEEYTKKRYSAEIAAAVKLAEQAANLRADQAENRADQAEKKFAAYLLRSGKTILETAEQTGLAVSKVQQIADDLK